MDFMILSVSVVAHNQRGTRFVIRRESGSLRRGVFFGRAEDSMEKKTWDMRCQDRYVYRNRIHVHACMVGIYTTQVTGLPRADLL